MENIKEGSLLSFTGSDEVIHKMEVYGICGKVVFTRDLVTEDGIEKKTALQFLDIDDLVTFGWILAE